MANIRIDLNTHDLQLGLQALLEATGNLRPFYESIGEHLINRTRDHFREQSDPDGNPWRRLSPIYEAVKNPNPGMILERHGDLARDIVRQIQDNTLLVGSPRIYAGTMQFGAERGAFGETVRGAPVPWGDIPARPFLGVSEADGEEILATLEEFLLAALENA